MAHPDASRNDHQAPTTLDYHTPPPAPARRVRPLRRRRAIGAVLLAAGALSAASTGLLNREPLRTNLGTVSAGFILWGLVLRFGSARTG